MTEGRITTVTYQGKTYRIPDIWIAGFCQGSGRSVLDAIKHWHYQSELAEMEAEMAEEDA